MEDLVVLNVVLATEVGPDQEPSHHLLGRLRVDGGFVESPAGVQAVGAATQTLGAARGAALKVLTEKRARINI